MWCARHTFGIGGSHTCLLAASTIDAVHKDTNWKAQQSCRGGTSWGVSSTPRLSWNTWARVSEHARQNNTQVNTQNTVEGSRLQSQGHTWRVTTYACFQAVQPLEGLGWQNHPRQVRSLLYQKVMWPATHAWVMTSLMTSSHHEMTLYHNGIRFWWCTQNVVRHHVIL